jgi:hypothetical protein
MVALIGFAAAVAFVADRKAVTFCLVNRLTELFRLASSLLYSLTTTVGLPTSLLTIRHGKGGPWTAWGCVVP